ncbi:Protein of unknown function [Lactobacillus helveticus CIRM-BIA 951]|uniref:Uncharacterized protein n=1 Tax=Lactobacillus helveticus CIRM-BIA 951 TaxID=1226334 RepID=U6F5I4_LACHE|nr:Protein of unknown function [Lactobacillus helveticus CIRM-BIA 951]
MKNKKVELQ